MQTRITLAFLLIVVATGGCERSETRSAPGSHGVEDDGYARVARAPTHVDSIFPMEEELRRFRADLEPVDELRSGAASIEDLVNGLISALEQSDTAALTSLALTRAEFAWLYFPHTMYTAPPYELPPGLVWYQLQNRSLRGFNRLVERYSGETLHHTGFDCPDDGETFGEGRIWHGCTVLGELPTGEKVQERLFGSVLELHGRYKLVGFSNEL